ncbi:MAG: hypothetical protein QOE73_2196 [Verrucomicrobiota bacterium]
MTTRNTSGICCARSYRTLRDDSLEGRFPRYFVPGYDRVVPPGHDVFSVIRIALAFPWRENAGKNEGRLFRDSAHRSQGARDWQK